MNKQERTSPASGRRVRPSRVLRVGLLALGASVLVLGIPLLAPLGGAAKYVVAPGVIGACFGVACILNGSIDAMKGGD